VFREWKLVALGVLALGIFVYVAARPLAPQPVGTIVRAQIVGFGVNESRLHPGRIVVRLSTADGRLGDEAVLFPDVADCRVGDPVKVQWAAAPVRLVPGGCVKDRKPSSLTD
jgi:hypothetical protein